MSASSFQVLVFGSEADALAALDVLSALAIDFFARLGHPTVGTGPDRRIVPMRNGVLDYSATGTKGWDTPKGPTVDGTWYIKSLAKDARFAATQWREAYQDAGGPAWLAEIDPPDRWFDPQTGELIPPGG